MSRRRRVFTAVALMAVAVCSVGAHELRPGFLELRETGSGTYSFLWKKPSGGEVEIYIAPIIPAQCRLLTSGQQQLTPGALVVRGTLTCEGGIQGKTIAIDGLASTVTDVIVRVHHADGRLESHLLKPMNPSVTLGAGDDRLAAFARVPGAWLRAHPARRRSPAVRARPAAHRRRPLDAAEDHHVVHRGPQHHARHRDTGLRQRALAPTQRLHRAQHPVPRARRSCDGGAGRPASRSGTRGSWLSRSDCCTGSGSPAG